MMSSLYPTVHPRTGDDVPVDRATPHRRLGQRDPALGQGASQPMPDSTNIATTGLVAHEKFRLSCRNAGLAKRAREPSGTDRITRAGARAGEKPATWSPTAVWAAMRTGTRTGRATGTRTEMRTSGSSCGAEAMTSIRRVPPSRLRYEAAHPTVGVHCDVETKARLVALRDATGLSLGALVKQALGVLERDVDTARRIGRRQGLVEGRRAGRDLGRTVGFEEGRRAGRDEGLTAGFEEGREAGFADAVRRYRITYPCNMCGKLLAVEVGSEVANQARQALINARWAHRECPSAS
jgi:hypothetical protein